MSQRNVYALSLGPTAPLQFTAWPLPMPVPVLLKAISDVAAAFADGFGLAVRRAVGHRRAAPYVHRGSVRNRTQALDRGAKFHRPSPPQRDCQRPFWGQDRHVHGPNRRSGTFSASHPDHPHLRTRRCGAFGGGRAQTHAASAPKRPRPHTHVHNPMSRCRMAVLDVGRGTTPLQWKGTRRRKVAPTVTQPGLNFNDWFAMRT